MSSLDYLDLCRLCLVKDRVGISIFEDDGDVRQVFLKIASCLPVKVSREDKLPKKICDDCMYKLELFYQFWNTTANAEKQLLQWLDDVDMQDKQGYVTEVLNSSIMKQEQQASENRLDESVMQVSHQNNMGMGMMDNMGLGMPIIISTTNQPMTSVPMDTSGSSVQTIQAVPGTSTQSTHDQISQNQSANVGHHEVDEDSDEDEENESDDECDADDGLPVKEENEEDPNNRTVEPTTFVNVSLPCDEAGPSGLQQQKITEMPEMAMPQVASADNKTGMKIVCKSWANETFYQRNNEFQVECKDEWIENDDNDDVDDDNDDSNDKLIEEDNVVNPLAIDEHDINQENRIQINFPNTPIIINKNFGKNPFSLSGKNEENNSNQPPLPLECVLLEENPTNFPCDLCDKVFKYKRGMREHMKRIHTNIVQIECTTCGLKCSQYTMARHVRTHHTPTPFQCKKCKKTFVRKENLEAHMQRKHKKYPCPFCTKVFPDSRKLNSHMRIYHDLRPFPCMVCNKHFTTKQGMHQHLLLHTGKRPYACDICQETFIQKSNLNFHRKSHPGPLPPAPTTSVQHILQKFMQNWERKRRAKRKKTENDDKDFEEDETADETVEKKKKNFKEKKEEKKESQKVKNSSDKESDKKLTTDTNKTEDNKDVKKIEGGQVHIKMEIEV
ncbi:zinc finger protein 652-B-like isoform X13 [Leptopilina heterotoma]|uniref:zinc finger protein 652-B-like isoform X13 n=1 Tax=Leptopilina heterotoma TaxID=63436 RepID=UPI001CAA24E0|nr:zinc finger protein 652-B-like isoform X13 [Leptopilina heterotoma]